ncbi:MULTISPECIES: SDR family NAD(P)-dependent oxidoreductase [unclassified Rhizobium]|uniref:SDR family NAD(P)-dependent oxidoreductase n=1 Tax=unclassified Rhizobium TaxID=2613769 RepID=UPI001C8404B3|nr:MULTISPECIES: SDR family oxidoreductase [unclassified Rhizobium]MBX5213755.1 SDR family oxidoreductase [Rhizobium sp. NLR9a]MBX5219094.1 SDR family oxidoreductase [Rhizobium sp. NLR8a]MBX5232972.1 SDR family oxidoreductase [Rhizobium sp. NLR4a]MBX5246081.1 SDR family oxidoreductase [Rhizobium sp. NLR3b]MBX5275144.1 SDR family oxidoreductase [Rhizobium sp. NLR13a]
MTLSNKTAVVTGSSRGIGFGIAQILLQRKMNVVLNGRDIDSLKKAHASLGPLGQHASLCTGDVCDRANAEALVSHAVERYGSIDVLVNNAGLPDPISHFLEMTEDHWDTVMNTNLRAVFLCSGAAAQMMADAGGGSIVHISSMAALRAHRSMAAYDVSKAAVEALTRSMALDLAPFGVRVNAVSPGPIHVGNCPGEDARAAVVPLGRVGLPSDIGRAVAFVASDEASFITGQVLYVDGGMLQQLRPLQLDSPWPDSIKARLSALT